MRLRSVDAHLKEKLRDPHFRKLFELEQEKAKIAALIIKYRVDHRLSQGGLAKTLGVTQQQISKIEQGEFSNLGTIQKVLVVLGYHMTLRVTPLAPQMRVAA